MYYGRSCNLAQFDVLHVDFGRVIAEKKK
jgi:hypothetical protein